MKRYILFLLVAMLECGIMFSQNNRPLSPMLNISGEFKRDYKDVKKGSLHYRQWWWSAGCR